MDRTRTYAPVVEPEEGGFIARFPALPDCRTWGDTFGAAVRNAEEASAVYIEALEANGDLVPEA
jgi:predicted RNase H-like HicB family nuclease